MTNTWRVGIDSGGTFTDVCLYNTANGDLVVWKTPSTPDDPSCGITQALDEGLAQGGSPGHDVSFLAHGTTVGTNALIQHHGVSTGLITTQGFGDLLEIGRQKRPNLYDLQADKPQLLVPRALRIEVPERCRHDGSIEIPLDEGAVRAAASRLREAGVKAVAICFLYGFLNPAHERRAAEIASEELPNVFVCTSHEVAPEFREFERLSTTVVNAYLGPVMEKYINRLIARLDERRLAVRPFLTQSNGGVTGLAGAARLPVRTLLSGPSTGVVAAQAIGQAMGINNLITFDMGGTSTDVALLTDGQCSLVGDAVVDGYPIKAPMLDIHAVGAGGGSIAHIDRGGMLKVGPASAGAVPGPACYGHGNAEPTVTDANVVLGTLNPDHMLGGRMALRRDLAEAAIGRLAGNLGMDPMLTADGIIAIATATMAKAVRVISVQRGHDPRDYALIAFGGAGPLHAARLARELGMTRVIIPPTPGTLCALGLLMTDLRTDFSLTDVQTLEDQALPRIAKRISVLLDQATDWFEREAVASASRRIRHSIDMRHVGQNYELSVPLPDGPIDRATIRKLRDGFAAAHLQRYGFASADTPIELVTFRTEAIGTGGKAAVTPHPETDTASSDAIVGSRRIWFADPGDFVPCAVYARGRLLAGHRFEGPAIVEQDDTTIVVPRGMRAWVEPYLNLIMEES
ncbi:hydantoinase/oxoprolinase family protein [Sphingosinicella microcystinivorans]|uniref:hydantoinase/oxoprolinase family protein n=1 Tax=Sphingosinicella microcystinivorans TaxID=335406 RepID=UPI0022F3C896|nr:hydantoinase/oxoprolinase family protein [Sphingosinicella microcystinivorans]WBX84167.1 hydantoinase/oxoprolinase family protein [Sphingosinicella microcystinivorans]